MVNDIALINNIGLLYEKNVVLYGASIRGEQTLEQLKRLGLMAEAFCDSDSGKWGTVLKNVPIVSPAMLREMDAKEGRNIIISSAYVNEILGVLDSLDLKKSSVFTVFGLNYSLVFQRDSRFLGEEAKEGIAVFLKNRNLRSQMEFHQAAVNKAEELLEKIENGEAPVVVYSCGKTGSRSVYDSLLADGQDAMHIHYLNIDNILNDWEKSELGDYRERIRNSGIKLVTMVRDPVARDCSEYLYDMRDSMHRVSNAFPFLKDNIYDSFERIYGTEGHLYEAELFKMTENMDFERHGKMFDWFSFEFKNILGIDLFDYPFDKEQGYTVIDSGRIQVMLIKLEKLDSLEKEIAEFTGSKTFHLSRTNTGEDADTGYGYREFMKNISFSDQYLDRYYHDNPYFDWFYTGKEKQMFYRKWKSRA